MATPSIPIPRLKREGVVVVLEKKMAWDTPKEAITMYYWCVVLDVLMCRFEEDEDERMEIEVFEDD
ncbi:hypothetical protein TSUD_245680 [Trifolium subterraneum]|uniref:Uncharacterized protein n=1 Tax=Trifolium subterraneum TaxID=3900 RepID=A0A2Z6PRE8_TRISU|nr:hypothetical protein TSUD_245680 [Trifolium subterraneum]